MHGRRGLEVVDRGGGEIEADHGLLLTAHWGGSRVLILVLLLLLQENLVLLFDIRDAC